MILQEPPRDVRVDRDDEEKYQTIAKRLGLSNDKEVFFLAMKFGSFSSAKVKLKSDPKHKWQLSTFSDKEVREMMVLAYAEFKDIDSMFDTKKVVHHAEELANGGIKHLYRVFIEEGSTKDDARVVEEIVEKLKAELTANLPIN